MRMKSKILFVSVAIVLFLFGGYYYCKYRQTVIEQIAKNVFVRAVDVETYKRTPETDITVSFSGKKLLKKNEAPQYIVWHDKSRKKKYKIDSEKHWKNITMDSDVRIMHSCTFKEHPLNLDSLNYNWQNLLKKEKLVCRTGIRMCLTDWNEKETSLLTSDSKWFQELPPFWVCTIGYRCEMECLLYLQYPLWQILGFMGIIYILVYIFIICTIYRVAVIIRRKMNPATIATEENVLVKEVKFTAARLYHLGGDIYFDIEKRTMSEGEKNVSLTNQSADLLTLFLQEDTHVLSINAIGESLWGANIDYENRVYQAINRLRGVLKQFPSLSIDKVSVGNYQLKVSGI